MTAARTDCAGRTYENAANRALLDLLPAGQSVLDCGCGAGQNAEALAARGWTVTAVTISEGEAARAGRSCARVVLADLERGLPDGAERYDVVLLSHVLEHLRNPERLLADGRRVLAPGGVVAVALPNVANWRVRLNLLCGHFDYANSGIMDDTHVRFYTQASAARLLAENGYRVLRRGADGWLPVGVLRSLLPRRVMARLDGWATRLLPGLFGFQHLLVAAADPAHLPHGSVVAEGQKT